MSLKEEDRKVLVMLELEKAEKTLIQLDVQLQAQLWEMAANRLYYSLFHAVSALLISDHHEVGTHRGAVNKFSLYYVKEGVFTKEEGRLYSRLQRLREDGDYNCYLFIFISNIPLDLLNKLTGGLNLLFHLVLLHIYRTIIITIFA